MRHTARVMCLAWSPNSELLATGSIDTNVCVYNRGSEEVSTIKGKSGRDIFDGGYIYTACAYT